MTSSSTAMFVACSSVRPEVSMSLVASWTVGEVSCRNCWFSSNRADSRFASSVACSSHWRDSVAWGSNCSRVRSSSCWCRSAVACVMASAWERRMYRSGFREVVIDSWIAAISGVRETAFLCASVVRSSSTLAWSSVWRAWEVGLSRPLMEMSCPCFVRSVRRLATGSLVSDTSWRSAACSSWAVAPDLVVMTRVSSWKTAVAMLSRFSRWSMGRVCVDRDEVMVGGAVYR